MRIKQNSKAKANRRLTVAQVDEIRDCRWLKEMSYRAIAKQCSLSVSTVRDICNHKMYKDA
jgi:DNA invertase Pin-like site-specific DNA recombinase